MSAQRWDRLADTLKEVAVDATVSERSHSTGVSRSITIRRGGHLIVVADRWWSKNPDVWIGYEVYLEGPDAVVKRTWRPTKKRSQVCAAVREALEIT